MRKRKLFQANSLFFERRNADFEKFTKETYFRTLIFFEIRKPSGSVFCLTQYCSLKNRKIKFLEYICAHKSFGSKKTNCRRGILRNLSDVFMFILLTKNDYKCRISLGSASISFPFAEKLRQMLPLRQYPRNSRRRWREYTSTSCRQERSEQSLQRAESLGSCRGRQS